MQAQTVVYEGYVENGRFYPLKQPILELGKVRAILTVMNEPVNVIAEDSYTAWHNRLKKAIADSMDEDLPDIPRLKDMRPPINFID